MEINKSLLGHAIQSIRKARGLTQAALAHAAGLSEGGKSLALIEQGRRAVSVDSLNSIAKALQVPPACLTILGSETKGKDKPLNEFIESLQGLISTIVVAQEKMRVEEKEEARKKQAIAYEKKRISDMASHFRSYKRVREKETL